MKRQNEAKVVLYLPEHATDDIYQVAANLAFRFPLTNRDRPAGREHCVEYVIDRDYYFFFVVVWWTKSGSVCARAWVEHIYPSYPKVKDE